MYLIAVTNGNYTPDVSEYDTYWSVDELAWVLSSTTGALEADNVTSSLVVF